MSALNATMAADTQQSAAHASATTATTSGGSLESVAALVLTTGFPPQPGGVEKLAHAIVSHSQARSTVLAPSAEGDRIFDAKSGVPTVRVAMRPSGLPAKLLYQVTWRMHPALYHLVKFWRPAVRAAAETRPNVIHCGHVYLGLTAWLLARRFGASYTICTHAQEVLKSKRDGAPFLDAFARGWVLRQAGAVFAPSEFTRRCVLEWGLEPERVVKIPYGAALPELASRAAPGYTILSVGRLVERKGLDTVIRALPQVQARFPKARYSVVGSGPEWARLVSLARSLGVDQAVEFVGAVPDGELDRYFRQADVFAMPCRQTADGEVEGFGIVYLEAGAHGLPCIAGRSGGTAEAVVHDLTGLVVDPYDVQETADALLRLFDNPDEARRMGQAGRARVEQEMNWQNTARVVDSVFQRLVAKA